MLVRRSDRTTTSNKNGHEGRAGPSRSREISVARNEPKKRRPRRRRSIRARDCASLPCFLLALTVELHPVLVAHLPHLALHGGLRRRRRHAAVILGCLGRVAVDRLGDGDRNAIL